MKSFDFQSLWTIFSEWALLSLVLVGASLLDQSLVLGLLLCAMGGISLAVRSTDRHRSPMELPNPAEILIQFHGGNFTHQFAGPVRRWNAWTASVCESDVWVQPKRSGFDWRTFSITTTHELVRIPLLDVVDVEVENGNISIKCFDRGRVHRLTFENAESPMALAMAFGYSPRLHPGVGS